MCMIITQTSIHVYVVHTCYIPLNNTHIQDYNKIFLRAVRSLPNVSIASDRPGLENRAYLHSRRGD